MPGRDCRFGYMPADEARASEKQDVHCGEILWIATMVLVARLKSGHPRAQDDYAHVHQ